MTPNTWVEELIHLTRDTERVKLDGRLINFIQAEIDKERERVELKTYKAGYDRGYSEQLTWDADEEVESNNLEAFKKFKQDI